MKYLKNILIVLAGNMLITLGLGQAVLANDFIAGGVTGIGLVLQHFIPIDIALLTGIINTVLFILGAIFLGKNFIAATALSAVAFPFMLSFCTSFTLIPELTQDSLLATVLGGAAIGCGVGLIIRTGGSTGGVDVISLLLNKFLGVSVSKCMGAIDVTIILLQIIGKQDAGVIYGLLVVLLTAYVLNQTLAYGGAKVQVMAISKHAEEIRDKILYDCDNGATMMKIETGRDHIDDLAVLTIAPYKMLIPIKAAIAAVDPEAFVVISNVRDVSGRGYSMER